MAAVRTQDVQAAPFLVLSVVLPGHVPARHIDPGAHIERAGGALVGEVDGRDPIAPRRLVPDVSFLVLVADNDRADTSLSDPVCERGQRDASNRRCANADRDDSANGHGQAMVAWG